MKINPIRSRGGGAILPPRLLAGSPGKARKASRLNLSDFFCVCIMNSTKRNCNVDPDRLAERGVKSAGKNNLCIFWIYLHFL